MNIIDLRDSPGFIPLLASWHHAEWSHFNPSQSMEGRITKMRMYLLDDLVPSTFVAIDGDMVLGSAALVTSDLETHPELTPWMASVYVHPDHRQQGIGSALVKHVMEQARTGGFETLHLFTEDQVALYQGLGWQTLSTERYHDIDITVMKTEL